MIRTMTVAAAVACGLLLGAGAASADEPKDPRLFSFFLGLNDEDSNGVLSVEVVGGLSVG